MPGDDDPSRFPYYHRKSGKNCRWSDSQDCYVDKHNKKVTSSRSSLEKRAPAKERVSSPRRDEDTGRRHRDDPHESSSHAKKRDPSIDQVTSRFSGLDFGPSHPADRHTALPPTKKSSHVQYPQATGYGPGQPTPPQQSGSGELPPKRPDAPYGAGGGYGQRSGRSNTVGSGGTKGDEATGVPSEDAWKCMSDRSAAYGPSKDPAVDFARGNVVEFLEHPPESETTITPTTAFPPGSGRRVTRYVIIEPTVEGLIGVCFGLPIKTYNNQGLAYPGVKKSHHAMIYTGHHAPAFKSNERPQRLADGSVENGAKSEPIRVVPDQPGQKLDDMSRLNFSERKRISHNYGRIRRFGKVHRESEHWLWFQYQTVLSEIRAASNPQPAVARTPPARPAPAAHPPAPPANMGRTANPPSTSRQNVPQHQSGGAISLQAFRELYRDLTDQARQHGLTMPQRLTEREERYLAENVEARRRAFSNLSQRWRHDQGQQSDSSGDEEA